MPDKVTLLRVLLVIEKIAIVSGNDERDESWGNVYKLAHAYSEPECEGVHGDWAALLPRLEEELKNV